MAGKFVKNYENKTVDIYIGGRATPTMRARLINGKEWEADFVDKNGAKRYEDFKKYYSEYVQRQSSN